MAFGWSGVLSDGYNKTEIPMTAETDMVERVAKAICAHTIPCLVSSATPDDMVDSLLHCKQRRWKMHEEQARAAIAAMREPTEAMQIKGMESLYPKASALPSQIYRAMINAALSEKGSG